MLVCLTPRICGRFACQHGGCDVMFANNDKSRVLAAPPDARPSFCPPDRPVHIFLQTLNPRKHPTSCECHVRCMKHVNTMWRRERFRRAAAVAQVVLSR